MHILWKKVACILSCTFFLLLPFCYPTYILLYLLFNVSITCGIKNLVNIFPPIYYTVGGWVNLEKLLYNYNQSHVYLCLLFHYFDSYSYERDSLTGSLQDKIQHQSSVQILCAEGNKATSMPSWTNKAC